MKTYVVEVVTEPQQFIISANSEPEAKILAKDRFRKSVSGLPIRESNILEVSKEF